MNLDHLSDFVLVAANGSFAQASRRSGRPKASLSRKVMELEISLGVRLFERGLRSLSLTTEGELLFQRSSGPLDEIAEVMDTLRNGRARLQGHLKIGVPSLFGMLLMGKIAAKFTATYPHIELEVIVEDREVDLLSEGYDLVIRANPQPNSDLVGSCFLKVPIMVVSAPSFADRSKPVGSAEIDDEVPAVVATSAPNTAVWQIIGPPVREVGVKAILKLSTFSMIRDATLTGIGVARLPQPYIADDLELGRLICWGQATIPPTEMWVLHASRRLASARVNAFMQFLKELFRQDKTPSTNAGEDPVSTILKGNG